MSQSMFEMKSVLCNGHWSASTAVSLNNYLLHIDTAMSKKREAFQQQAHGQIFFDLHLVAQSTEKNQATLNTKKDFLFQNIQ